ncbi:hypothetical protein SCHPADRAFT_930507 [Schizopora paradoxa]|uniref:Uncharacterized protein n=1 Tax=Schizopora paradoxa TaxID=27342 RepID=A0A0H2RM31_9AGAM|nr:hypothetical protein SCHPADRAFT_930507 [Schizopora paradoxa]
MTATWSQRTPTDGLEVQGKERGTKGSKNRTKTATASFEDVKQPSPPLNRRDATISAKCTLSPCLFRNNSDDDDIAVYEPSDDPSAVARCCNAHPQFKITQQRPWTPPSRTLAPPPLHPGAARSPTTNYHLVHAISARQRSSSTYTPCMKYKSNQIKFNLKLAGVGSCTVLPVSD